MAAKRTKRRRRRLGSVNSDDNSDHNSADDVDLRPCAHMGNSVHLVQVRKFLKASKATDTCKACETKANTDKEELLKEELCSCLMCGHHYCLHHSRIHASVSRSGPPHVVFLRTNQLVSCLQCDLDLQVDAVSAKTREVCALIQRHRETLDSSRPNNARMGQVGKVEIPESNKGNEVSNVIGNSKVIKTNSQANCPRKARGLVNLGNTCYFNSVLQCLAQLGPLHKALLLLTGPKARFRLPHLEDTNECSTSVETFVKLTEVSGEVTRALTFLLDEMNSENSSHVINPSNLLGAFSRGNAQFRGYAQQDAHECLRAMMDAVKSEETRRQKRAVLNHFGLDQKEKTKQVDENLKQRLKTIGKLIGHTLVDRVLGGYFVATIRCDTCGHASQTYELFLDISLSLNEPKFTNENSNGNRKNVTRNNSDQESSDKEENDGRMDTIKQRKRERERAKKEKKSNKGGKKRGDKHSLDNEILDSSENKDEKAHNKSENNLNGEKIPENKSEGEGEDNDCEDKEGKMRQRDENDAIESDVDVTVGIADLFINEEDNNDRSLLNTYEKAARATDEESNQDTIWSEEDEFDLKLNGGDEEKGSNLNGETLTNGETNLNGEAKLVEKNGCEENNKPNRNIDLKRVMNEESNFNEEPHINGENGTGQFIQDAGSEVKEAEAQKILNGIMETKDSQDNLVKKKLSDKAIRSQWVDMSVKPLKPESSSLSSSDASLNVLTCLSRFVRAEHLRGDNRWLCDNCSRNQDDISDCSSDSSIEKSSKPSKVFRDATRQVFIYSPPWILTLQLKRFEHHYGQRPRKINRAVKFPLLLDLAPYCAQTSHLAFDHVQHEMLYALVGVVEHAGDLNSGHYTAFVKVAEDHDESLDFGSEPVAREGPSWSQMRSFVSNMCSDKKERVDTASMGGKWYHVSDTHVSAEVSVARVLKASAFLLFYQRIR